MIPFEAGPGWIDDPARDEVDPVPHSRQLKGDFFDVHQLTAEVGMLCPITIQWIKIPLGIQECDVH